jgi:hypothetical protein
LSTRADLAHESALHQSGEPRSRRTRGQADHPGDLTRHPAVLADQSVENRLVSCILHGLLGLRRSKRHPELDADLFQHWRPEACIAAGRHHALNAAAPLLHQPQIVKHASD